tara:strand:+ start:568 stop:960 length:393 start_codon:yes stop_codon:yes gene_type:complete
VPTKGAVGFHEPGEHRRNQLVGRDWRSPGLGRERRHHDLSDVVHDKEQRIIDIGDGRHGSFGGAGSGRAWTVSRRTRCAISAAFDSRIKGVPLFQIGGWLDHSDAQMTELYSHHHSDFQGKALDAFNRRN